MTIPYAIQANAAPFYQSSVVLSNAQIKALPSTPIEIVPIPPSGQLILPIACSFVTRFLAGAYANVHAVASLLVAWDGSTSKGLGSVLDSAGSILTFAGDQFFPIALGTISDGANGQVFPPGDELHFFENKNLMVVAVNALGSFTGGNAANTLVVTVIYTVVDI